MASDIWLRTILIVRKETRCRHIGYSFRLTAMVLLYAPSHRQDSTYHGLLNQPWSTGWNGTTKDAATNLVHIPLHLCVHARMHTHTKLKHKLRMMKWNFIVQHSIEHIYQVKTDDQAAVTRLLSTQTFIILYKIHNQNSQQLCPNT